MQRRSERLSKYVEPDSFSTKTQSSPEKRKRSEYYKIVSPSGVRRKNTGITTDLFNDLVSPIPEMTNKDMNFSEMLEYYKNKKGK